jgi:hypothetical protein
VIFKCIYYIIIIPKLGVNNVFVNNFIWFGRIGRELKELTSVTRFPQGIDGRYQIHLMARLAIGAAWNTAVTDDFGAVGTGNGNGVSFTNG